MPSSKSIRQGLPGLQVFRALPARRMVNINLYQLDRWPDPRPGSRRIDQFKGGRYNGMIDMYESNYCPFTDVLVRLNL